MARHDAWTRRDGKRGGAMVKRSWSREEIEYLKVQLTTAKRYAEIAREMGRTVEGLKRYISLNQIAKQDRRLVVKRRWIKEKRRWTNEEIEYLKTQAELGTPAKDIASDLGRTRQTVSNYICKFGVSTPRRRMKKRICLRCDRKFRSKGIDNRLCPHCREFAEANSGIEPYQVGVRI